MNTQTKIPTVFAILLLFIILGGMMLFFEVTSRNDKLAKEKLTPRNVTITNLSDNSFTVSWQTDEPTTATVNVSNPVLKENTFIDDRDQQIGTDKKNMSKRITHHISLKKLNPNTNYTWTISSGGVKFQNTNGDWNTKTYNSLSSNNSSYEPSYGTAINENGKPAEGALVYLTLESSQILSTIVNPSGSWLIPLSGIRTNDGTKYLPYNKYENESIKIISGDQESTAYTDISIDSPVQAITLGKTFDFRKNQLAQNTINKNVLGSKTSTNLSTITPTATITTIITPTPTILVTNTVAPTNTQTPTPTSKNLKNFKVSLTQPKQNANLTSQQPLIQGTALPGENVLISLSGPENLSGSVKTETNGIFQYTPTKLLAPGLYTITITTLNNDSKALTLSSKFNIFKSGTQVLGDATSSSQLTQTITPTLTITRSTTPLSSISATISPTITKTVPVSGTYETTAILSMLAAGLFITGTVLFLK